MLTIVAAIGVGLLSVIAAAGRDPHRPGLTDFNVFHMVGGMIRSGHYADAYRVPVLVRVENAGADRDHQVFMPWSYPPAFGFVLAPLAALPLGPAYLAFLFPSLVLFCVAMRRLGGDFFWPVFLAAAPSLLINIRTGQNGLLIGGLEALAAGLLLRPRPLGAGLTLAGLVFKPHLGLTLPLLLVLQRRWLTLGIAAAAALAVTGLSLLLFGPQVFAAFLDSLSEVRTNMADGAYPLQRMTSLYASLLAAGVPDGTALALHAIGAATVLSIALRIVWRAPDLRLRLGLAVIAGLFVSPYLYDYDLTVFGVGLMLLAPTLASRLEQRPYGLLLLTCAVSEVSGMLADALGHRVSLGGPLILGCTLAILWVAAPARDPIGAGDTTLTKC